MTPTGEACPEDQAGQNPASSASDRPLCVQIPNPQLETNPKCTEVPRPQASQAQSAYQEARKGHRDLARQVGLCYANTWKSLTLVVMTSS